MSGLTIVALIAVLLVGMACAYSVIWFIDQRVRRIEEFLGHMEHRLILLQNAEFGRVLQAHKQHWRDKFCEEPPDAIIHDVRAEFPVDPPYSECVAAMREVLRRKTG